MSMAGHPIVVPGSGLAGKQAARRAELTRRMAV